MTDILQAARSYYGLADTESCTTQLFTNQAGQTCVAFEIALSNEDFAAIVQRMQNMQQPDTQPDTAIIEGPTVEAMREAYNALSKAEKGRYGSFARYMVEGSHGILGVKRDDPANWTWSNGDEQRQVVHVDAPEEPEHWLYQYLWIPDQFATEGQKNNAADYIEGKGYMIPWAILTDEQKQKANL